MLSAQAALGGLHVPESKSTIFGPYKSEHNIRYIRIFVLYEFLQYCLFLDAYPYIMRKKPRWSADQVSKSTMSGIHAVNSVTFYSMNLELRDYKSSKMAIVFNTIKKSIKKCNQTSTPQRS